MVEPTISHAVSLSKLFSSPGSDRDYEKSKGQARYRSPRFKLRAPYLPSVGPLHKVIAVKPPEIIFFSNSGSGAPNDFVLWELRVQHEAANRSAVHGIRPGCFLHTTKTTRVMDKGPFAVLTYMVPDDRRMLIKTTVDGDRHSRKNLFHDYAFYV